MKTGSSEHRLTLHCAECGNNVRVAYLDPMPTPMGWRYCPLCGSTQIGVRQDGDLDYWEVLGNEYGYPAKIMEALYDAWDTHEFHSLADFVNSLKEEIASGKSQSTA